MVGTSARSIPSRGRRLALGATAVVTVGLVSAYASAIGAQTSSDPIRVEVVSVDGDGAPQDVPGTVVPAISDTGGIVVYEASERAADAAVAVEPTASASLEGRRVWIRDRVAGTSGPVAETGSVAPGVSGDGCLVAYTVASADQAALTVVDRCTTPPGSPLPIGTVLDTYELDAAVLDAVEPDAVEPDAVEPGAVEPGAVEPDAVGPMLVAPPSLSLDGSVIVWSTGREVRRYTRPADGGPHVRSHTFDVVDGGSPGVVTGIHTDVSADGGTVVFVAGPGTSSFEPDPADVYAWTLAAPQPELISATSSGDPALSDSTSPTITADGSFIVFESSDLGLPVVGSSPVTAPFVVGVDRIARTGRILVDDARSPSVSADGNHVVYRRGDAVRVLSSDAESTIDHEFDELADARPTGALSISQYGRWIVFGATIGSNSTPAEESANESSGSAEVGPAVWAVDRVSSNPEVVDTTTSTTQPPPPTSTAPPSPSVPTATDPEVESLPTVPATTLLPTASVPRFPTVTNRFPSVGLPAPRPVRPSSSAPRFDAGDDSVTAASASAVTFEPTVVTAGRRSGSVVLTNVGSSTLQVTSTSSDLPEVFAVIGDTCSGATVAPGSSCTVEVQFAPPTVGPFNAVLTFVSSDGSLVTATLSGEGVPEPTLDLVPEVAGAGQTVTVFGAGFPAGSTLELSGPGWSTAEPVAVDVDGTFAHVLVVLPNTPAGSAALSVRGQPDVFADVAAELLVSNRRAASPDAALRGGPAGSLGR